MNHLPELNSFMAHENVIPKNELEKQLADWNFSNLILLFRIAGFDRLDDLKIITNDELNILFPNVSQQALKCRIRAKMLEWRVKTGCSTKNPQPSASVASSVSETPSRDSSPTPTEWVATNQQTQPDFVLEEFLLTKKGSKIKEYYFQRDPPCFNTKTRDFFIESFVDYIQTNNTILKKENFVKISEEIAKAFPGESPEIYYVGGRVPKGKLYNKYKNKRHRMKSYECPSPETTPSSSSTTNVPIENEYFADDDYSKLKQILFSYTGYWSSEQNHYWEMTHLGRMAEIKKSRSKTITDYFDEWPVLRKSFAFQLIENDFDRLYPGRKFNLLNNWDNFVKKLVQTTKNYKESKYKNILNSISEDKPVKDAEVLSLLTTILKPTCKYKNIHTNKLWKPTLVESSSSIYIDIDDIKSLKLVVDEKNSHYASLNSSLKPFIVGYNNDDGYRKSFSVIVGGETYYNNENFISCLDTSFKLFIVFNLEYPMESKRVWFFIQKYFFNITTEFDWIDGDVQLLITELNR